MRFARSFSSTQNIMERITRDKVYAMTYWKEKCFAVSAEALVDLAVDLRAVGGIYGGNNRATEFLCLTLKLLQIQPEKEIILEFIKNEDHKYVRLLGAFYLRLVGKPTDVYQYLEPLLNDYRKVRYRSRDGKYVLTHVDEFVNNLLTKDMFCDVALPRVPHRQALEAAGSLEPRVSALETDVKDLEEQLENAVEEAIGREMRMDVDGDDDELDTTATRDAAGKRPREEDEEGELANASTPAAKVNRRQPVDLHDEGNARHRSRSPQRRGGGGDYGERRGGGVRGLSRDRGGNRGDRGEHVRPGDHRADYFRESEKKEKKEK